MKRALAATTLIVVVCLALTGRASAWDSGTHRLITRIAVRLMPPSAAQHFFELNLHQLEQYSTDPDTKLKDRYGRAEERRHYIDLEIYGPNPWAELLPDRHEMIAQHGVATLDRSGTLPWTIEDVADASQRAWLRGDCNGVLKQSGYLAHYIGDASQPLHSTIHYDGYTRSDRGVHMRIENAVDDESRELARPVKDNVSVQPVSDVWNVTIAEIREANTHVKTLIETDRVARGQAGNDHDKYRAILMHQQGDLIERQLARAASVLAGVWYFEWQKAGSPKGCGGAYFVPIEHGNGASSAAPDAGIPSQ